MQHTAGKLTVFNDRFGFAPNNFIIILPRNGLNLVDNTIDTKAKLSDRKKLGGMVIRATKSGRIVVILPFDNSTVSCTVLPLAKNFNYPMNSYW